MKLLFLYAVFTILVFSIEVMAMDCCKSEVIKVDKDVNINSATSDIINSDTSSQPSNDICPVMGGAINEKLFVEKDGKKVYVCCQSCLEVVKKDFNKNYKKAYKSSVKNIKKTTTVYTCSMHPEMISEKPGTCHKCGMALELKK